MLEMFLGVTTTRFLKMNFPAWQLFLKTLPRKCWPQYLGNYSNNTDQGLPYCGEDGGSGRSPPISQKLAHPSHPPGKIPLIPPPHLPLGRLPNQIFVLPTKGSFPPLNNNFLNSQSRSSSDSRHPIKKSPQQNSSSHCTGGKGFSPYPLKLFGKLWPPSFQSLNQSFISNQRIISM